MSQDQRPEDSPRTVGNINTNQVNQANHRKFMKNPAADDLFSAKDELRTISKQISSGRGDSELINNSLAQAQEKMAKVTDALNNQSPLSSKSSQSEHIRNISGRVHEMILQFQNMLQNTVENTNKRDRGM